MKFRHARFFSLFSIWALSSHFLFIGMGESVAAWDYWLQNGGAKLARCSGSVEEMPIKLANRDGQWVYIDGVAGCKDRGSNYELEIKFLRVTINGARSGDIQRDPIKFDWIGVELYRQVDGQEKIDWIFHDERPVDGSLANRSENKVVFGNLQFSIPKSAVDRASRMTFYLTAQGIPFTFQVL